MSKPMDHGGCVQSDASDAGYCVAHGQSLITCANALAEEFRAQAAAHAEEVKKLKAALEESVWLQSGYAESLNVYDGGHRIVFADVDDWVKRLAMTNSERIVDAARRWDKDALVARLVEALKEADEFLDSFRRLTTKQEVWQFAASSYDQQVHNVVKAALAEIAPTPESRG